ncbi:MAG: hydroxyacid dehydrogenase [Bacteroidetes bacterium GWF2_40_14]|nr:MAG: hydroxyacid dehydrogenase [Bacteroidetes bacterium GWF2_40_14]
MKIVFLDSATIGADVSLQPIETLGDFICYPSTSPEQVAERVKDADVLIVNKVLTGKDEIDAAPNLKLICVAATGMNNVNIPYANSKGIPVKNVFAYSTDSVAQITFSLVLALISKLGYFDNHVKTGEYCKSNHYTCTDRTFFELKGKNFGIIGMGTIGKRVAEIAKVFGANVSYYSTNGLPHCKDYPSVTLDELLAKSDIISVHAPLNDKTRNLISLNELRKMKPTAYIVNMGRGGIINEEDLAKALDFNLIAGAGIDVYENEPIPADHPYLGIQNMENIILTPHIGWASVEARKLLVQKIAENIKSI